MINVFCIVAAAATTHPYNTQKHSLSLVRTPRPSRTPGRSSRALSTGSLTPPRQQSKGPAWTPAAPRYRNWAQLTAGGRGTALLAAHHTNHTWHANVGVRSERRACCVCVYYALETRGILQMSAAASSCTTNHASSLFFINLSTPAGGYLRRCAAHLQAWTEVPVR